MNGDKPEGHPQGALTSIHDAYTLAATHEEGNGEVNDIAVKHFLEILAEVALAVVSRKIGQDRVH